MNFFGHAAVAADYFLDREPVPGRERLSLLCCGAMLPDFIGMLRLGRPEVRNTDLALGVAFHHHTDRVFHELASFHELSRGAFGWLSARQLGRGPARAVAHIGVEMLLDEVLAADPAAREAYRAALAVPLAGALRFGAPSEPERLAALREALLQHAGQQRAAAPGVVAQRIRRTLSARPRLATDDAGERVLASWVESARPEVGQAAPALLAALRARLARFQGPE